MVPEMQRSCEGRKGRPHTPVCLQSTRSQLVNMNGRGEGRGVGTSGDQWGWEGDRQSERASERMA